VSLLRDVVLRLETERIPHVLIGAAAMAVHGVSRATADVDLLTLDARALAPETWATLKGRGVNVLVLKGDPDDPLAGVVRLAVAGDRAIVVVVGRHAWQREIIEGAETVSIGEVAVKVVRPAGLVLLKLYAGGPRDAWDVRSLLESRADAEAIAAEVERMLPRLPQECGALWKRIRDGL
jgi:predicted nucleotidyltransferase